MVPARFQGALDAARPSRFQGIVGNGFSVWLGRRWGLSGGRAPAPVAKSFRQVRNPFVFGRWPRPAPSAPAHYAFFPTLSLAVVLRPMASLFLSLSSAPERHGGATLPIKHESSTRSAFSPTFALALSLRSMDSQFSVSQFAAAATQPAPERRNEFTLPIPRERRSVFFLSLPSKEVRERSYSRERERSREQTWTAFLRETAALATSIPVAHWYEMFSSHAFAAPAAQNELVMLKLVERQPLLFQEWLVATMSRNNQTIAAGVPAAGSFLFPRFAATFEGAGTTTPRLPASGWSPRVRGLLAQSLRTGNGVQDEAAWLRQSGPARARAAGANFLLNWQTGMRFMTQAGSLNVTHLWPAPLSTQVGTSPARITYQVNVDGSVSSQLVLVGNHSMVLANHLPESGRVAVKLAMAGAKIAPPANEEATTTPRLTYAEPLASGETGETAAQGATSFDQMALHYQQREALAARNISEALSDLRQSLHDFKQAPALAPPSPPQIDQLTRQVYDELKRELRIERERRGL